MGSNFLLRTLKALYCNLHNEIDPVLKEEAENIKIQIEELEKDYQELDKLNLQRPSPVNFIKKEN